MTRSAGVVTVTLNPAIDRRVAIPGFASGRLNRVVSEECAAGGKGVNVASFLADLRFRVTASGLLGADNATIFEQHFSCKGITDSFVRVAGSTRVNLKVIDETTRMTTEINFPGATACPEDLSELLRTTDSLLADHACFVVSGSVPAGVPVGFCGDLIRRLQAAGKRVLLDSSGDPLRHGVAAAPWAMKPNLAELEDLVGGHLPDQAAVVGAARELLAAGVGCVVVSLGQAGAIFVTADQCLHAVPPAVEVRCTVGAGDAMVAGFVAGSLRGWSLADCARLATACALAALTQPARTLPPTAVVAAQMAQVVVRPLDACSGWRPAAR